MDSKRNKIIHELENLFPGALKIYNLPLLRKHNSTLSNTLLHRNFNEPPVKKIWFKLLWEIACFLETEQDTAAYSFFYRLPEKADGETDWVFCAARLNRCEKNLPGEIALFSYQLQKLKEINKKLYWVLENGEFFKDNLHKVALLTKREKEIIRLLASGLTGIEIAAAINLSVHTVYTHRKSINSKLNIQHVTTLLKYAEVFDKEMAL
ncbi:MAG: helix-turn-helix transcriptional regulator [Chitinophagaceae bacterium]|nr:helix-turn-helix transcriptional regulator [Chitinophagaceae bacterium]MBL0200941.1 helix-turn-helix transcriptional regulator [Chitinophagaceae bacterium]